MTTTPPDARNALAELLPCPFCGGKAKFLSVYAPLREEDHDNRWRVKCEGECKNCGSVSVGKDAAAAAWNRRASDSRIAALEAQVEGMRVDLEWYGEQARLARLIHSEGDKGRWALAEDGGKRARAALRDAEEGGE